MAKSKITVHHDKDGVFKVYQDGPKFVAIPDPENFKVLEDYSITAEVNPAEFLTKWPRSNYDYEVVGKGVQESTHTVPEITQADVEKYGAAAMSGVPPGQRESLKQELIQGAQPMQAASNMPSLQSSYSYVRAEDDRAKHQRLMLIYTKLQAKLGTLKGKPRELLAARVQGFKEACLILDNSLNDLLVEIEADI